MTDSGTPPSRNCVRIRRLAFPTPAGPWGTAMLDDVGTSCATTNATPETSFAPRHGVDAPSA
ncbi:hypothetical protein GCM10022285_56860 [Streptomyces tunisiensis]|uniref:Uncharacterized protein n=1 Tax=Streptomyces tunisiensis TaxID=948699 RepID=A0ABP7Z6V1_9ACTN